MNFLQNGPPYPEILEKHRTPFLDFWPACISMFPRYKSQFGRGNRPTRYCKVSSKQATFEFKLLQFYSLSVFFFFAVSVLFFLFLYFVDVTVLLSFSLFSFIYFSFFSCFVCLCFNTFLLYSIFLFLLGSCFCLSLFCSLLLLKYLGLHPLKRVSP